MIISCEKCKTKYRLDASRLSHASVKVQCSKCDHIFIVPAAGEERKKRDLYNKTPHEDNGAEGDKSGSAEMPKADPHAGHVDAHEPLDSHLEPEEQSYEENKESSPAQKERRDPGDLSFEAEEAAAEPPQSEAEVSDVEEKPEEEESGPAVENDTGLEQRGGEAEAPQESENINDEGNKEAPLPWEESANSFDMSFGAAEHQHQSEAEASGVEEKSGAVEDTAPLDRPDEAEKPLDNEGPEEVVDLDVKSAPETKEADFDLKELIDGADAVLDRFEVESEVPPSFKTELIKAASDADKAGTEVPGQDGETMAKDEKDSAPNHDFGIPDTLPVQEKPKKSGIAGLIAIIVIIIALAGGLMYMKTRPDNAFMAEQSPGITLEIESAKGYYVLNKHVGRIFVIETMLKNITDGPVKISGIRGLVMDSSGREMARKMVSPGRVVTAEDLRNLPVETLLKSFSDTSAGTMPKKSTIPTMVLFTDLQKAVAEYGIDVLR